MFLNNLSAAFYKLPTKLTTSLPTLQNRVIDTCNISFCSHWTAFAICASRGGVKGHRNGVLTTSRSLAKGDPPKRSGALVQRHTTTLINLVLPAGSRDLNGST